MRHINWKIPITSKDNELGEKPRERRVKRVNSEWEKGRERQTRWMRRMNETASTNWISREALERVYRH